MELLLKYFPELDEKQKIIAEQQEALSKKEQEYKILMREKSENDQKLEKLEERVRELEELLKKQQR